MTFPASHLHQKAVYWGNPTPNGRGGWTFDDAVEIDCRWADSTAVLRGGTEEEVIVKAEVIVDQDLDEGGYLWLGELDDLESSEGEDPKEVSGATSIKKFEKIPTARGTRYFRRAYL